MTQTTTDTDGAAVEDILASAAEASEGFGETLPADRARLLRAVADAIDADGEELVSIAMEETHLPAGRLGGELIRTTFQLRLFAGLLDDGLFLGATIDHADPDWPMGARPDLRRVLDPIGPVAVFAASNFPFAFSVAGGDTASALASGCPVVLKAHPGHPQLSALTGDVVRRVLTEGGAPLGTFAVVYGEPAGRRAITDSRVRASAFTGSLRGGRVLFDLASSRPDPIPFYGEFGSLNPVFVTAGALAERRESILSGFADSFTLGAGQFCTKPGLMFVPLDAGIGEELASLVRQRAAAPLLNEHIHHGYTAMLERLVAHPAITPAVHGDQSSAPDPTPTLLSTTADKLIAHADDLLVECFGPTAIIVTYRNDDELLRVVEAFDGQLTATVHGGPSDPTAAGLVRRLRSRSGRVLWNGWPTGVSVTGAMHHGGPFPATTNSLHTSVGTAAITRFLRPICYQSMPQNLLPPALRDDNPLRLPRWVDGHLVQPETALATDRTHG